MIYQSIILKTLSTKFDLNDLALKSEIINQLGIVYENYRPELNIVLRRDVTKESIGIKEVKAMIEWNSLKSEALRIGVITEADKLTIEAQNSLLKLVEEPSQNTLIILQTINPKGLLQTIRSRCRVVNLERSINPAQDSDQKNHDRGQKKSLESPESGNYYSEFLTELLALNFVQRQKKLEKFFSDGSRGEMRNLVLTVADYVINNQGKLGGAVKLEMTEVIKKTYFGAKSSTNSKLLASTLNLVLEDLK